MGCEHLEGIQAKHVARCPARGRRDVRAPSCRRGDGLRTWRLKAAVHYTVGCLCEEVASDREIRFSKQTIAAISELTFRQCENFAKDLEMFARHAKRSTINTEDVKLLARRSNSLLKYITEKSEELAQFNSEQRAKKKKKLEEENQKPVEPAEAAAAKKDNSSL
ncbi:centromere protein S isoform X1 [Panthera onca]|uniref:centromere protein S-like isoform X3 n=1 Tax=Panthera leo TaxID=9689 RepID=UPI001C6A475E|nr:centromere protein S-like isoform X3 [Panthera leo]XP_042853456.1 centromere protein S-like isoform X3 [Panthera tigris]XP_060480476.1 centromere protein S isoform X1 [Panthera onca]